jgi:hypothetical protein
MPLSFRAGEYFPRFVLLTASRMSSTFGRRPVNIHILHSSKYPTVPYSGSKMCSFPGSLTQNPKGTTPSQSVGVIITGWVYRLVSVLTRKTSLFTFCRMDVVRLPPLAAWRSALGFFGAPGPCSHSSVQPFLATQALIHQGSYGRDRMFGVYAVFPASLMLTFAANIYSCMPRQTLVGTGGTHAMYLR